MHSETKALDCKEEHGISVPVDLSSGQPKVVGEVPSWMTVYDDNVLADLGFAGDVSIASDRVKVRKRFLGWANFVFDTHSPFFDKLSIFATKLKFISVIINRPRSSRSHEHASFHQIGRASCRERV